MWKQRFTFEQMLDCSHLWHTSDSGETSSLLGLELGFSLVLEKNPPWKQAFVTSEGFLALSFAHSPTEGQG